MRDVIFEFYAFLFRGEGIFPAQTSQEIHSAIYCRFFCLQQFLCKNLFLSMTDFVFHDSGSGVSKMGTNPYKMRTHDLTDCVLNDHFILTRLLKRT